jgi:hypothetical protein
MIRLEALDALRLGQPVTLQSGAATLTPILPDWVKLPASEPTAS